jgi:AmmeMemoRadiSam system protein B
VTAGQPAVRPARVRPSAVAGTFYPDDPAELTRTVDALLAGARADADQTGRGSVTGSGSAFLVPHAGYHYSGSTAARVYARIPSDVDRVVLLGPAHFVLTRGCHVPAAEAWRTPLGEVAVDVAGVDRLAHLGLATVDDEPHRPEHSIEVQLPFLQRVLDQFTVLPIAVGVSHVDAVARTVLAAAGGERTVVICSSDLSHYLDEATATVRDEITLDAVRDLAPQRINARDACGVYALRGVLGWARASGATPEVIYRCTSAETGGDRSRVVGYAAVSFGAVTER